MTLYSRARTLGRASLLGAFALAAGGCTMVYKTTGDVLVSYSSKEMVPHLMRYDDAGMACAVGEALTPLLMSFADVGAHPDRLAPLVYTTAAGCSEQQALEEELRYLRAMKEGRTTEANDARTRQKELARLSAQRLGTAWHHTIGQYGEAGDGQCPRLRSDFDELTYMVGMIAGVQALLADATADTSVGIPRDIAARAERGMACLDNDKWWGVPQGTRAALWVILPMLKPEGVNAWAELEAAQQLGFRHGVRLPSALAATAAYATGDTDRVRQAIRDFAAHDQPLNPDWRLLDTIGGGLVKATSDRMWTEATGRRTPFDRLGSFWDDTARRQPELSIDDLL